MVEEIIAVIHAHPWGQHDYIKCFDCRETRLSSWIVRSPGSREGLTPAALGPYHRSSCARGLEADHQTYWFLLHNSLRR